MQRDCIIFRATDSNWYLWLARNESESLHKAPIYGPFTSFENAENELDQHSNPGGYVVDDSASRLPNGKRGAL